MPAKPRWLLAIPDAISQLEQLDRTLLTRRDIEHLFGLSKVRAAALMKTFGAEMTGNQRTLPRTKLLQQLKKHRGRGAFRGEEERRARLVAELQKARLTGVRFKGARRDLEREAGEPARGGFRGAWPDRGAVRRGGGRPGAAVLAGPGARERLRAVRGARRSWSRWWGRGGDGMTTEALVPAAAEPAVVTSGGVDVVLPALIINAGPDAIQRFLEEPRASLFQSVDPAGERLTGRALTRRVVLAMIKRRAAAAGLPPSTCCHTFRATGITAYLSNGGTLEHAQQIAGHASPKTTKLYDRTADTVTVAEIRSNAS